jgi:undecaprenyl-diphosphatase
MSFDAPIVLFLHTFVFETPLASGLTIFLAEYFPFLVGGALALLLARAQYSRVKKMHIFAIAIIAALIARVGIVELLRTFIDRERPYHALDLVPLVSETSRSFPSAHAAFFFALAAAIFQYNRAWGILFFGAACLISIARIAAGVHYPSDVLVGACIGIAVGCGVVRFFQRFEKKNN